MAKRILVPVDGSEQATEALSYALAEFPGAEIGVINVIDPIDVGYTSTVGMPGYSEEWYEESKENAEAVFEEAQEIAGRARRHAHHEDRSRATGPDNRGLRGGVRPNHHGQSRALRRLPNPPRKRRGNRRSALGGSGDGRSMRRSPDTIFTTAETAADTTARNGFSRPAKDSK